MLEVGGSIPGRGVIVGVFHPTRQLARFSHISKILNLFRISPRGEAVNYRPYASPSFEVAKPRKITGISAIIIIMNLVLD